MLDMPEFVYVVLQVSDYKLGCDAKLLSLYSQI